MYKNFKITEEEKQQILESHMSHGYKKPISEQLGPIVKKLLSKVVKSEIKPITKMGTPLLHQLPNEVQSLIKSFPNRVKVGDKLMTVFNSHSYNIKNLEQGIKSQGGSGISNSYSKLLSKDISTPKGAIVDIQNVYSNAQMLKKELENIKSSTIKPKEGGVLNKNQNYKKQMETHYNKFYDEIATLNKFISDLEKLIKK